MSVLPLIASNYSIFGSIATGIVSSYLIYNKSSDLNNNQNSNLNNNQKSDNIVSKSDTDEFINLEKEPIIDSINNIIQEDAKGNTHILSNDMIIINKNDIIIKEESNENGVIILNKIPQPPNEFPKDLFKKYNLNIKVKCRFKNFKQYQKYLNNQNRIELLKKRRKEKTYNNKKKHRKTRK